MGRIFIDTDELNTLAQQLRADAGEFGEINLDLVRAWSHALPPPVQLIAIGAQSGWIQAQIGTLAAEVVGDSALLNLEVAEVLTAEGTSDLIRSLGSLVHPAETAWSKFVAWGERTGASAPSVALTTLRRSLTGLFDDARLIADNPGEFFLKDIPLATSEVFRGYNLPPNFKFAVEVIKAVPFIDAGMNLTLATYDAARADIYDSSKSVVDTFRYGSQSSNVRQDESTKLRDEQRVASETLDGGVSLFLDVSGGREASTLMKVVTTTTTVSTVGLAGVDRVQDTDYSKWLQPSHDIEASYHWALPRVIDSAEH
jgi:hypothetical protein